MFFWNLSKGDSIITCIAKAYMMAINVSPQNFHAYNKIMNYILYRNKTDNL